MASKKAKSKSASMAKYSSMFILLSLFLAWLGDLISFKLEASSTYPSFFLVLYFVIFSAISLIHLFRNKEVIKKEVDHFIVGLVIFLANLGVFTLITSVILLWKHINPGFAYDFLILGIFCLYLSYFLWTRRHNLGRQGIMYLYRTKLGINFIDRFTKKFQKVLRPVQYLVLVSGYSLMVGVMWMMIKTTYLYLSTPIASIIRAPPVAPLIPYFPKIFGLESFFPPLYFTYFLIALAVVAITHEFSHGIFARLHKFKIHSTGFAFLGPILGAFVEPDEKEMNNAKKFPQLVILAAGTFANVIMTVLFGAVLVLFFSALFMPAGVKYNTYTVAAVNTEGIEIIGNSSVDGYLEVHVSGNVSEIEDLIDLSPEDRESYFVERAAYESSVEKGIETSIVYLDTPAFRQQMRGAIVQIDDFVIKDRNSLIETLEEYQPGDEVKVRTAVLNPGQGTVAEYNEYEIELAGQDGKAYMGIGFIPPGNEGVIGKFFGLFGKVKDPMLHYENSWGGFGWFLYYLLWWIVVINFLVALFNMLPLGILDGGRYFYLTAWGLTGSEKFGRRAYHFMGWFLLAILIVLMLKWGAAFF
jgi:membrane-associated protease RseP (regulator of RpoE activity)